MFPAFMIFNGRLPMEKTIVAVNNVFVLTTQVIHNKIRRACQQKHNKSRVDNTIQCKRGRKLITVFSHLTFELEVS